MADYPDWTDIIQIVGSDIMVPIDVQGAYIMMPVDIQAQYLTLDIDIVAQTVGNIEVDLVAQSVGNIEVDIAAQTIGNLIIDIEAQSIGLYLKADWEVIQGTDKNLYAYATCNDATVTTVLDYTVPAGKTFYICQWGFNMALVTGMIGWLDYLHDATPSPLAVNGGYCGAAQSFTKPIAVVAGDHVRVVLYQASGSGGTGRASVGGYEL